MADAPKTRSTQIKKGKKVPIPPVIKDLFSEQIQLFQEMYGRKISKNGENPYVFWNFFWTDSRLLSETVKIMRKAEVNEELVYVYYKTEILPSAKNLHLLSKTQKREIKAAQQEYRRLVAGGVNKKGIPLFYYVKFTNNRLSEMLNKHHTYLESAFNDFIRRHLDDVEFINYGIRSKNDFLGFCCLKVIEDLHNIKTLRQNFLTIQMYSCCRSMLETYFYVTSLAQHEGFFQDKIIPALESSNYQFEKMNEGRLNYTRILLKRTNKRAGISLHTLAQKSKYKTDMELYDIFYRSICQFVHLDPLSAQSYLYDNDPFTEIDSELVADLLAVTCATILLEQFAFVSDAKLQFRKDITHLVTLIKKDLLDCFHLVLADELNHNDIFSIFKQRIEEMI